jgi:hypothetical protein
MDAIETETVEHAGQTYRIAIYPDGDAPNPLDDWSEFGTLLSLNRRHDNFDPIGVEQAIRNADAVPLSYYEHGRCLWSVAGELPLGCRCPWDSVALAGVWLPDAATLASASRYGGRTRLHFMRKRARQACDVYTQWCNGEVYGYEIERVVAERATVRFEPVEQSWGYFGLEYCLSEARQLVQELSNGE